MVRSLLLLPACSLLVWLTASDARADAMCGGSRRHIDPPPPSSSTPATRPVGALDTAPDSSPDPHGPAAPVEIGMMAGMVLLGGGAAASSRGRKKPSG